MKKWKRAIAFLLTVCMVLSLLPPVQIAHAAETIRRYELDMDGIDVGATYLIVDAGTAGSGNVLKFYYLNSNNRDLQNQSGLMIRQNDNISAVPYIEAGFTNEADCQFQFSGTNAGNVTHGNYYLDLDNSRYASGSGGDTLTFTHVGNGKYQISCRAWFILTYYLRYNNDDWTGSTTTSSVYLYKLVEHVVSYDVTYNGNGYTSGTLPENATDLDSGTQYTVPKLSDDLRDHLRKDVGEDTWLFLCWNTKQDGSGQDYAPGASITVTEDVTLYAKWYQQTKHTVVMKTYLDGGETDIAQIVGEQEFYARLEGGGTYIPMSRKDTGVYSTKVAENGTYVIYAKTANGEYKPVHDHKVVIYNQNGEPTDCFYYSVKYEYDANSVMWAEGGAPANQIYHHGEAVTTHNEIPTREGYRFLGWKDQHGNLYSPGQRITDSIGEKITLTAQWEELIDVTVNVTINHNAKTGGTDNALTKQNVTFTLLRLENGVPVTVEERTLTEGYTIVDGKTTYQVVFMDMPQGIYRVTSGKSGYDCWFIYQSTVTEKDDQEIQIGLEYKPDNFDLTFDVVVSAGDTETALMPKAVNVKVTYWGNKNGQLGWHTITQQDGNNAPSTVTIDVNGKGTGSFPVWRYWSDTGDSVQHAYEYRVEVTSFILPDGTVVPASSAEDHINYTITGSNFYHAGVSIVDEGREPGYPPGSNTELTGAYFDSATEKQVGVPTVTVDINPYTVTFDAGTGTVNGEKKIILEGQYRYPSLHEYVAEPNTNDRLFICWTDENGNPVTDQGGQLLNGNVTYYARYNENLILSGTVTAAATYQQDDQTVYIHDIDHAEEVYVVLQKKVGDVYNDIDSALVKLTYEKDEKGKFKDGVGSYRFENLPNDGTEYRVQLRVLNYTGSYDNNSDQKYDVVENVALIDVVNAKAQVDIKLLFEPDQYEQGIRVDASRIHKDLRPTDVLIQILYRDLGDVHNYQVISQHTVDPFGIEVELDSANATGFGYDFVWNWHPNGTLYEYQVQVNKVYGNVAGAYSEEGLEYTADSPYTVVYGRPNNYLQQEMEHGVMLEAKLVPKQYAVKLDLGEGVTSVEGLEEFMVDDGSGNESYMFLHTWSYAEQFTAYPYREGYVFKGWKGTDPKGYDQETGIYTEDGIYVDDGVVRVGNTLAKEVTLVAQWEKMKGTDYTVRYLELNTDKVLKGATMVTGTSEGYPVIAADAAVTIEGYVYAGALVNGTYVDKDDNPAMTVTSDPKQNLMIIYYLPDGSDGYTEQVESNLEINKTAVLEDDGTYTITLDTWTKDNPITTLIQQNTPLDIVLVLDQSGSLAENNFEYLTALQTAVGNFVESVADHGRRNEVDHRIAMVGYAGNASDAHSSDPVKATGGKTTDSWINTGVFDSNGEFHLYNVNGFNYTKLTDTSTIRADGVYYTKVTVDGNDKYLLLTHHNEYRHLISEEDARVAVLQGETVFGYVYNEQNVGGFVELTRNSSGLWLYGNKKLYSATEFFTYHTDVWTHRDGVDPRQIHAYGVGAAYAPVDGHEGVYTRTETTSNNFEHDIYVDALVPVSVGSGGSGGTNPGLMAAVNALGADGATRASYGMEMANEILKANPAPAEEGRVRMVVMFTDGEPGYMGFDASSGQSYYDQAVTEANNAITQAYTAKNTYGAYVYSIGLYESAGVDATSEVAYYMNALSSNYPNAQNMDSIKGKEYTPAQSGTELQNDGSFFVKDGDSYYVVKRRYTNRQYRWYYTKNNTEYVIAYSSSSRVDNNGQVGGYPIYRLTDGYAATDHSGYYSTTESPEDLQGYFEKVLQDITTKITTEIILHEDTILRDIMGQGLVLTPGTVVTAYAVPGKLVDGEVEWTTLDPEEHMVASVEIPDPDKIPNGGVVASTQKAEITSTNEDGTTVTKQVPYIQIYNLNSANPTDPAKADYHPHTVDITGYDFEHWYISDKEDPNTKEPHTKGFKMVVTITRVEARDDVEWGKSTLTNNEQSGLWLPADAQGKRELLLPFDQPTTIFVERAYVLDYGKTFTLRDWYFDDETAEGGTIVKPANPVHVDCDITNGMNWFNPEDPNTKNSVEGTYGNTKYGNVQVVELEDKSNAVTYTPTTTNWDGYDQFYVFGDTWRKTVLAQDANENGNLWNKVTVIPANNIYYEDSFITATSNTNQNGIDGFTFSDTVWEVTGTDSDNTEVPEKQESAPYGDVHGWTDSLGDDLTFTDGSAHLTSTPGAQAELTFTGTGVEVYTRTNAKSGMVVAVLSQINKGEGDKETAYKTIAVDNLAVSGDYYHIPTVTFKDLPYGTYKLQLIATEAEMAVEGVRTEYYIDGVRIHNPLGNTTNYQSDIVKDAYGLETNAVFTEIRDVLLDYEDFNKDMDEGMENGTDGKMGAVFIDWIGTEESGIGQPTYDVGIFETYGPKNEVYLTEGQAIVLKVEEGNTYYVGMKSLTGKEVTAHVSGIDQADPTKITLSHTTDMYYQVTPVGGYIVIQNGSAAGGNAILSITKLRTTNLTAPVTNGGILGLKAAEAVEVVSEVADYIANKPAEIPQPEVQLPSAEDRALANEMQAMVLFADVRQWLETE